MFKSAIIYYHLRSTHAWGSVLIILRVRVGDEQAGWARLWDGIKATQRVQLVLEFNGHDYYVITISHTACRV